MLKTMRNLMVLVALMAVAACNSVTAPITTEGDRDEIIGVDKDEDQQLSVDDNEFTPPEDGGGGYGPGERDRDEPDDEQKRFPHDYTPGEGGEDGR